MEQLALSKFSGEQIVLFPSGPEIEDVRTHLLRKKYKQV